jgi:primosomal protein N' (replication factor Y)
VLHSALTDTERLAAWRQCVSGEARIVLGTRSAVFAPVADLGMVIVDEEHDASFKQHESGSAIRRATSPSCARNAPAPVVLGSATPSLETLQNVASGKFTRCRCRGARAGAAAACGGHRSARARRAPGNFHPGGRGDPASSRR